MEGMRLGAFDFLMKPLQIEELIEKIKAAIEKASGEMSEQQGPERNRFHG